MKKQAICRAFKASIWHNFTSIYSFYNVTIYISYRNNSYTYLSCIEKDDKINYFAFNNVNLQNWDSIEEV